MSTLCVLEFSLLESALNRFEIKNLKVLLVLLDLCRSTNLWSVDSVKKSFCKTVLLMYKMQLTLKDEDTNKNCHGFSLRICCYENVWSFFTRISLKFIWLKKFAQRYIRSTSTNIIYLGFSLLKKIQRQKMQHFIHIKQPTNIAVRKFDFYFYKFSLVVKLLENWLRRFTVSQI